MAGNNRKKQTETTGPKSKKVKQRDTEGDDESVPISPKPSTQQNKLESDSPVKVNRPLSSASRTKHGSVSTSKETKIAHTHPEFEFGGPIGALGVIFGLPIVILALYFLCNEKMCINFSNISTQWSTVVTSLPKSWESLFSREATIMYLGWMAFHVILERILPGQ